MSAKFDLVVRGGLVADGGGGQPHLADVAVADGLVAQVGAVSACGAEEIDARGCVVTPGFVDLHTHYDGQVTWEDRLQPSSVHGVTTVLMGNCGVGFAPMRQAHRQLAVQLMEGVEDIPEAVMAEGLPWDWDTFPSYLDALERRRADIDFAAQIPHSPLRVFVMGDRGVELEPPTADELAEMRRLTTEAVQAGALGVSTSRLTAHRFRDGRPAPSVRTGEDEVLALAAGLRDAGAGVFEIAGGGMGLSADAEFALFRKIAETSGRPVSFLLGQSPRAPDAWKVLMRHLDGAAADGLVIRGQVLPRPPGVLMGLELSYHPFSLHPSYREVADLPLAEKVVRMKDPALRARLLSEEAQDPNDFVLEVVGERELLFVLGDPPNYNPPMEDSIGARARREGRDPHELIYDALLSRGGREILFRPLLNIANEDGITNFELAGRRMLGGETTVLGSGDGGAHYAMICDASYPTYFLSYWVVNAPPDRRIDLGKAVRMLAWQPAAAVGLCDRGLLRPGYKADLNVIDLSRLRLHAPEVVRDLPAGGSRLRQKADGYVATVVSGQVTYRQGQPTGALPGRLQRHARPEPVA